MTDKKLDELPAVTTIVGTNILHQKNIGGDGTDKHITFSDFVKSIITDATATGSVTSGNYLLIQNAGVTYKVTVDQLLEDMGGILSTDNTNLLPTDHLVWNDVSTGNTKKATVVSTVDKGIVGQATDTATPTEIVCIVGSDTKRVTFANVAVKLESALSAKTLASDPNADYVVVSDGTLTQKATYQNFFKEAINMLPATTPTYGATSTLPIDAAADGNAVKDTVKNLMQKAPALLDIIAGVDIDKANDTVLVRDVSAGVTKQATITDALGAVTALAAELEQGTGSGSLIASLFGDVVKLSTEFAPTNLTVNTQAGVKSFPLHGGSAAIGGMLIMWGYVEFDASYNNPTYTLTFSSFPFFRSAFADKNYAVAATNGTAGTTGLTREWQFDNNTKTSGSIAFYGNSEAASADNWKASSFILIGKAA